MLLFVEAALLRIGPEESKPIDITRYTLTSRLKNHGFRHPFARCIAARLAMSFVLDRRVFRNDSSSSAFVSGEDAEGRDVVQNLCPPLRSNLQELSCRKDVCSLRGLICFQMIHARSAMEDRADLMHDG